MVVRVVVVFGAFVAFIPIIVANAGDRNQDQNDTNNGRNPVGLFPARIFRHAPADEPCRAKSI